MIKYNNSNSNNRINNIYYNNKYKYRKWLNQFFFVISIFVTAKKNFSLASLQNTSAVHAAVQY